MSIVTNIAALRALTTLPSEAVYVEGYTSAADGGQGPFIHNPADTTSSDNGGTIIVDAGGHRWYRDLQGKPINVGWFGGGPAIADNTSALLAAFHAAGANAAISFAAGKFAFGSQVSLTVPSYTASLTLLGQGAGVTELTWSGANGGIVINYVSGSNAASFNSVQVRDMSLTTGQAGSGTAITLNMTGNSGGRPSEGQSALVNLDIHGSDGYSLTNYWSNGVVVTGVSQVAYNNVSVTGNGTSNGGGTAISISGTSENIPVIHNFSNCTISNSAVGFNYGTYTQGVTLTGCNITGGQYGILTQAGLTGLVELVVQGCQIETNNSAIVTNTFIADLIIRGNVIYVAGTGGIALNQNQRTSITGNHIYSAVAGGAPGSGIYVGLTVNDGGVISNNLIIGFGKTNAISLDTNSANFNVQSNYYNNNRTNVSNSGVNNTVGGGSP